MNQTRFFSFLPRFCMDQQSGDGGAAAGGAQPGAPAKTTAATTSNDSASATVGTTAGQAAEAEKTQTSQAASVQQPVGQQAGDGKTGGDFRAEWPDELKNDPALKDFKDTAALAKAYADTKKLVGQKLGIPGPDATPEQKDAFYEALGVPKEAAGYDFKIPDNIPEALKSTYDQAHADKWAARMKELGIPKEAAQALRADLFKEIADEVGEMSAEVEKSDKQFKELAVSIYGDEAKANAALERSRAIIEKHLPAPLKAAMAQLSNTALLAVAAAIGGETKALTGEDKTISRESGETASGKTIAQLREEARSLQALPEYNSAFTPKGKTGHDDVVKRVKDIYAEINTKMAGGAKA